MTPRLLLGLLAAVLAVSVAGCGGSYTAARAPTAMMGEAGEAAKDAASPAAPAEGLPASVPRKIIYTLTADLVVQNLGDAEATLTGMVKRYQGYVASTEVTGTPGTPRTGTWKLRIPSTKFEGFRAELNRLGELQNTHLDSQDVTEEYFDVQAQISNK
ncbi:MAG: hypothetical protein K0Q72_4748, partial [Armatimonadetes bacterium]|nr:hypothetical protein [Armatimonadota bacterium]